MLAPCYRCYHKNTCELRKSWRDKLSGLGLTSARFLCERRLSEHQPGSRVEILLGDRSFYARCRDRWDLRGTITGAGRGSLAKVHVHLDDPESWIIDDGYHPPKKVIKNESGVISVHPGDCRPTGEIVEVCGCCGWPAGKPFRGNQQCDYCLQS